MDLETIETWVRDLGAWGLVAYLAVFVVLTSVFVPDTLLAIVAGVVFGVPLGIVLVVSGALLAAALQYLLARRLLRDRIERGLAGRPRLRAIRNAVLGQQIRLQVLLRLTPLNPATVSYVLGASGVRAPGYLLACLALIPLLALEVWLGRAGSALASDAHVAATVVGIVACVLIIVLVTRAAMRALEAEVSRSGGAVPDDALSDPRRSRSRRA